MIRKIKNFLRRKKKLKKSGLREHVEQAKSGNKGRVYTNAEGEKFVLRRERQTEFTHTSFPKGRFVNYTVKAKSLEEDAGGFSGTFFVDRAAGTINIARADFSRRDEKGYGVIDVLIDEAKEIAKKEFRKKSFEIEIGATNSKLYKYYMSKGFEPRKEDESILYMKVRAK